jgi:uncharacterized membrane protein YukC
MIHYAYFFILNLVILMLKIVINLITNLINRFPLTPLIFLKFYKFLIPSIVQFKFNFKNTKNTSQLEHENYITKHVLETHTLGCDLFLQDIWKKIFKIHYNYNPK